MQQTTGSTLTTALRSRDFLETTAVLKPVNESGARKELDAVIDELSHQAVEQHAGRSTSMGETQRQAQLRDRLYVDHLKPIAAIADARLGAVPELAKFRLPKR